MKFSLITKSITTINPFKRNVTIVSAGRDNDFGICPAHNQDPGTQIHFNGDADHDNSLPMVSLFQCLCSKHTYS
jgi:hypothetical protein